MKKQINVSLSAVVLAFCAAMTACADSPTSVSLQPSASVIAKTGTGTCPAGYTLLDVSTYRKDAWFGVDRNKNLLVCRNADFRLVDDL